MPRFRRPPVRAMTASAADHMDLLVRWTARLLVGLPQLRQKKDWAQLHELAPFLGMEEATRGKLPDLAKVQDHARGILRRKAVVPERDLLSENLARLGETLGLSAAELDILRFRVLLQAPSPFRSLCMDMGPTRPDKMIEFFAVLFERTADEVSEALNPGNRLSRAGLLQQSGWGDLEDRMQLMEPLYRLPVVETRDTFEFFRSVLIQAPQGGLDLEAYPHLKTQIRLIESYLDTASKKGQAGVNILLYGPPGTGKTELARALAKQAGQELMEVALENENGDPLRTSDRWGAYRLAQRLLRPATQKLLLVDEVESLLIEDQGNSARGREMEGWKAWINRALESNPIPTIWITNKYWVLDSAFRRRFDVTLQMNVPPRSVRRAFIESRSRDLKVSARFMDRLAEVASLSPANLDRAVKVLSDMPNLHDEPSTEQAFAALVDQQMKLRQRNFEWKPQADSELAYRMDWLNTDPPLDEVITGMKASGSGRLCLYGLPGTGKSAFAKELAIALDRPLLLKRGSDIFGPYVGQSEQNIAAAFQEAAAEGAVLVMDEVDSFLQDRRDAKRTWETSTVNELLTQMESFDGIFVATTNLVGNLDPASLRRFDLKVKFQALHPEQSESLIEGIAKMRGWKLRAPERARARSLRNFTPGDAAAILRQARFRPLTGVEDLLERLTGELKHDKGGEKGKVGF